MAKRTSDATESGAVEAPDLGSDGDGGLPQHGFFVRLYTGTGAFEVVGRRKLWYSISGVIVAICIASIVVRGFTFGIDFEGGTKVSMPAAGVTTERVEEVFSQTLGKDTETVVVVGSGPSATVQIRSEALNNDETDEAARRAVRRVPAQGARRPAEQAGDQRFGGIGDLGRPDHQTRRCWHWWSSWCLAAIYIAVRYERYMAISAMATLVFDLVVTAGVYSLVGFEVTPATVIGLLTILGFSLYDTVIVFDKVEENTHGFQHTTRRTFAEQANLAINQTFMRSINTSLISVLPIISLMVVAVWLLGVGTLKDLALVQLVGVIVGTYSSIFFATPLLVTLRERTELVRTHTRRVLNRRKPTGEKSRGAAETAELDDDTDAEKETVSAASTAAATSKHAVAEKPAPGARPIRPTTSRTGRPAGKRNSRRR